MVVVNNMFKLRNQTQGCCTFWLEFSLFNIKAIAAIFGIYDNPMVYKFLLHKKPFCNF